MRRISSGNGGPKAPLVPELRGRVIDPGCALAVVCRGERMTRKRARSARRRKRPHLPPWDIGSRRIPPRGWRRVPTYSIRLTRDPAAPLVLVDPEQGIVHLHGREGRSGSVFDQCSLNRDEDGKACACVVVGAGFSCRNRTTLRGGPL